MGKILVFPVLLAAGCLISGLYGAVHNQISYTVSPEYFHAYKFVQFDIPADLHNRVGASLVGWRASWRMGMCIGLPLLAVGLLFEDWKSYLAQSLGAFGVVAGTTLVTGLGALAYASCTMNAANLPNYPIPERVVDRVAFARVGTMHNFSYLGGMLGVFTGSGYLIYAFVRRASSPRSAWRRKARNSRNEE